MIARARAAACLAAVLWLGGPCAATADELTAHGRPLALAVEAVPLSPERLAPGVALTGAWVLAAGDADFGGLSGLLIEDGRMLAVTDRAHWVTARIDTRVEAGADGLLSEARIAPVLGASGRPLDRSARDAEALARSGGELYVAFEGDHRIMRHAGGGRLTDPVRLPGFAGLGSNSGIEGLATLPDGRLLALAEGREADAFPVWALVPRGPVRAGRLPARSIHDVTGADIGPDGRLYLVQRHWSRATGVSMRLLAYALDAEGMPLPDSAEELAAFGPTSGIDNMEGIAVLPGEAGGLVLWILSDDNFNPPQRTLLLRLALAP